MTKKEYLTKLNARPVNESLVSQLEMKYNCVFPEIFAKIISNSTESVFFDDGSRILSVTEIMNADDDLHIPFTNLGIVPFVDCGENDFIVFHVKDGVYSIFNIVEECFFRRKENLTELFS